MKIRLHLWALIFATTTMVSCGDDDDTPPPHEVGTWDLKNIAVINVPSGFQRSEGRTYPIAIYELERYLLDLQVDGSYSRELSFTGSLPIEDKGSYVISEDELILNSEDEDFAEEEIYTLERNEKERLWISEPSEFPLIEDAILDTITQEYINNISDDEYKALFTTVNVDLIFAFEREQ